MASTDAFFTKLIGYHDMLVNGGSLLPRRNRLNFVSGKVEDIGGVTQVTVADQALWLDPAEGITSSQNDFAPTGFAGLTDIAVNPTTGTQTITGFDATGLTMYSKRVWNLTTDSSNLAITDSDASSAANNRVTTPDGLTLTIAPGGAALLIRNAADSGWRVLPCLV